MGTVSETTRQRLVAQGFELNDDEINMFNYWLRIAPATCMFWVTTSLVLGSPLMMAVLIPVALLCFALARHPFDAIYNYGLRYFVGGEKLPAYGAPRRFMCLMASMIVAAIAVSFAFDFFTIGYVLGSSMVAMLLLNVITGKCGPCTIYNRVVGPVYQKA